MSALAMFLLFLAAVAGMATLLGIVGLVLLLSASAGAEAHAQPERDGDPFEPAAAEAPDQLGADITDALVVQRAEPFTGTETQPLIAGSPAIVAGEDLAWADRRSSIRVAEQFAAIASSMPELDGCDGLAEFYLRPEVRPDGR